MPSKASITSPQVVAGFQKVFDNLDEVMAHADDDIKPGFDGRLYGTG